jgi:hypothetical protein
MRFSGFLLLSIFAWWPMFGTAQGTPEIDRIADTMVRLCVGGGRTEATSGTVTGGTDLSLRSFDVKGNAKGEFQIDKSTAEGLVNGLDNALSQVAADQADKVRTCLQPVRERLLDVWLPVKPVIPPPQPQPKPPSPNPQTPIRYRNPPPHYTYDASGCLHRTPDGFFLGLPHIPCSRPRLP